ncbi:MAG: hypothetical protein QN122_10265 [Armatimonadota bacterium]|nr:hypothetical protein [Armatimonadota bacterium]MDR7448480.1 hypothetical protein [Armatimonadota bacterium]MDR7459372.1 hypothetical protein [Armatimonadota bacterium]MDR7479435.1 hypothetical protein [Armatimonadota bacterium]MDR7487477.1 hypothetical protein [Armatimonadota bacterium]
MTPDPMAQHALSLPPDVVARLVDLRVHQPQRVLDAARTRQRRSRLAGPNGRLVLLAADHPARMVTAAGGDPLALADRWGLLARIAAVLEEPGVDGVMGTADLLDDLLLLDEVRMERGEAPLLRERVLVGSMNRGGLAGSRFELDDRFTGYTARGIAAMGLDGGKLLVRVDPDDPGTVATLEAAARAVDALADLGLAAFVEVLPVRKVEGRLAVTVEAEALAAVVGVATGLGSSSRHVWLKLPACPGYDRVARATTCPILLLGGDVAPAEAVLRETAEALAAGPTVRGVLMGRNVLFPSAGTPRTMARAVAALVHEGVGFTEARRLLEVG